MHLARQLRDGGAAILLQPAEQAAVDAVEVPVAGAARGRGRCGTGSPVGHGS